MLHMLTRNHFDLFLSSKIVESSLRTRSRGRQAAAGGNVLTVLLVYISDKVKMCEPCYWSLYFRFIPQICRPNKSQPLSSVLASPDWAGIHSLIRITQWQPFKRSSVLLHNLSIRYTKHPFSSCLCYIRVLTRGGHARPASCWLILSFPFVPAHVMLGSCNLCKTILLEKCFIV